MVLTASELDTRLTALQPDDMSALHELEATAWSTVDPARLELCRIRIAALLGDEEAARSRTPVAATAGVDEAKVAALDAWDTSPLFDACERACLAFAEQFTVSVGHVGDADVQALLEHLSPQQVMDLSGAIYVIEMSMRVRMVARVALAPEAPA